MNSRLFAAALAAATVISTDPARGAFTTVVNVPPDAVSPGSVFAADTQINLYQGATANLGDWIYLGGFEAPAENVELNVLGGKVWAVEAYSGSQLNVIAGSASGANLLGGDGTMSGGNVKIWSLFAEGRLEMSGGVANSVYTAGSVDGPDPDASFFAMTGGHVGVLDATGDVVIQGGAVDSMFFRGGGFVELSGGAIGDDFEVGSVVVGALPDDPTREIVVGSSGRVTVRSGSIGQRMILRHGRTLDYSGGVIGDAFQALEGSRVNILGSHFLIGGVEPTLPAGGTLALTQRDVALTGLLSDGQPFHFDLNSQPGHGDFFSPEALVTIMLVPEPRTDIAATLLLLGFAAKKRTRHDRSQR